MIVTDWHGCYPSQWQGLIVPDAFSHPAKFSSRLIRKIYEHATEEGWLKTGDRVIDPFGGVALGALEAMRFGLDWTGVELEPRFVDIGRANIDMWNRSFSVMPRWGHARLYQGDSRRLLEVIGQRSPLFGSKELALSSPPYADSVNQSQGANDSDARAERKARAGIDITDPVKMGGPNSVLKQPQVYGATPGQLGALPAGEFSAALSSPPFLQTEGGHNVTASDGPLADPALHERHKAGNRAAKGYGETAGNLGNLPTGEFESAISSPPYADGCAHNGGDDPKPEHVQGGKYYGVGMDGAISSPPYESSNQDYEEGWKYIDKEKLPHNRYSQNREASYGDQPGQLGQRDSGDTFWTAARLIVEQTRQALRPGGHAIFVVKAFVKNHELVDFPGQWRELCEDCGFVTVHEHHALLVRSNGKQHTIDGGIHEEISESKSFFRRLAEKKGSPRIDFESVLCMEAQ